MATTTHTRTHTIRVFADPFLTCDACGARATGYVDTPWHNVPCGHRAGVTSACPSWGPVDGCRCVEALGRRDHADPA